ncbi:DUF4142 domain-containing protein [Streptomyces sp. NPDC004647]|uniref:DUF4142 domain-containing protein n=1 Tax=Streptomyces sp. NPDC004647 TaxID=3154671 RepID=UPI00339E94A8
MRSVTGTVLILVALAATLIALAFPVWTYRDRSGTGLANLEAGSVATSWGPLSAADRDFIVRVRLAGLWELPAGQQAIERAPTQAVADAGEHLVEGHTQLDARVRDVAARLGMELPNQPNDQQRRWLEEFTAARDMAYAQRFTNVLRAAHGKVFVLIGQIRNTTRNTLVRGLADEANMTVLDHITMLERTGMVDFDAIAAEATESGTASPTGPPPHPAAPADPPAAPPAAPATTYPLPPPATLPEKPREPKQPKNPKQHEKNEQPQKENERNEAPVP